MRRGFFIVLEGIEGAGKSVQTGLLASHLRKEGYKVRVTREPGGTRIGEQIRAITHNLANVDLDPKTEAYLMAAARVQHVTEVIAPALKEGKIVLGDRFIESSLAYQGYGRKLGVEAIKQLNELAIGEITPDLVLILDLPVEVGLARRNGTIKVDRLDLEQKDFYERARVGYLDLAKKDPNHYFVIDATCSTEKIAAQIWPIVKTVLTKHNAQS